MFEEEETRKELFLSVLFYTQSIISVSLSAANGRPIFRQTVSTRLDLRIMVTQPGQDALSETCLPK